MIVDSVIVSMDYSSILITSSNINRSNSAGSCFTLRVRMLLRELSSLLIIENVLRQRPRIVWKWYNARKTLHSANCNGSSCLYTGRCVDWTEMKSSRRVADRPAVQIGKTQRSSFMCIHVDDDDCEHGSAKQVVTLLRPLLTPIDWEPIVAWYFCACN